MNLQSMGVMRESVTSRRMAQAVRSFASVAFSQNPELTKITVILNNPAIDDLQEVPLDIELFIGQHAIAGMSL